MTQIIGWFCDICKKEFKEGDAGYSAKASVEIDLILQPDVGCSYKYVDACLNCRTELEIAISRVIKNATIREV